MQLQEQLRETERTLGVSYPPSFFSEVVEFSALVASESCLQVFGDTTLLVSAAEIARMWETIPGSLLPFMLEKQSTWDDIYAFDLASEAPEFKVVVWADHAVVMDWEGFPAFWREIRDEIAKHAADPTS